MLLLSLALEIDRARGAAETEAERKRNAGMRRAQDKVSQVEKREIIN